MENKEDKVILVNTHDHPIGAIGKLEAHQQGLLHRAFSIFIFNSQGEMLLQQRALHKYHSGGLWSNACCSHPGIAEKTIDAAHRRLKEELGFDTALEKIFDFVYRADVGNNLTEHEFDHVFSGVYDGPVAYQADEVMAVSFRSLPAIAGSLREEPEKFTSWFRMSFGRVEEQFRIG